ncbi:MAG: PilX N-terminal domain-containing pilus assembly protein [Xanthomonadales bacterium]|nr:PilX N-terminal domain-containing pilus assembly protein [Xanthomonadales bacterium]
MNSKKSQSDFSVQYKQQQGAVLLVGLMVLVVLALLGVAYSQVSVIQGRLAGNFKDLSIAFQSSESSSRWGMSWLQSLGGEVLSRPFTCNADCDETTPVREVGYYSAHPSPKNSYWSDAGVYGIRPSDGEDMLYSVAMVQEQPKYVMEQQFFMRDDLAGDPQKGVAFYRVTAKGMGTRTNSDAIVSAVIAKRFE